MGESGKLLFQDEESSSNKLGLQYNIFFSDNTDTKPIDDAYFQSMRDFQVILASSQASLYKICNHFNANHKLTRYDIVMLDGQQVEYPLDINAKKNYNVMQMKELSSTIFSDVYSKWVVIKDMRGDWTPGLAYMLYTTLKTKGAIGLIFNASGVNNLGRVMVMQTDINVTQFPMKIYNDDRGIVDDGF